MFQGGSHHKTSGPIKFNKDSNQFKSDLINYNKVQKVNN